MFSRRWCIKNNRDLKVLKTWLKGWKAVYCERTAMRELSEVVCGLESGFGNVSRRKKWISDEGGSGFRLGLW